MGPKGENMNIKKIFLKFHIYVEYENQKPKCFTFTLIAYMLILRLGAIF